MEISNVVLHPYFFLLPIGFVIVCAVLVFVFGFRPSIEPNFRHLSDRYQGDDRKGKKRKPREKKGTSGNDNEEAKEVKKDNAVNEPGVSRKSIEMRRERRNGAEIIEKSKLKKVLKESEEKPVDFDDGEWETAFSRKDKKNRKKEDEVKKPLPTKKKDSSAAKGKTDAARRASKPKDLASDTSESSLFAMSSSEKLGKSGYSTQMMLNKKKKKLRKD